MEALQFLVERCAVQINTQDRFGMTPLNRAEQVSISTHCKLYVLITNIGTSSRSGWVPGEKDNGASWNKKSIRYSQY